MNPSLLLTGHTGFVGTNLIRAFGNNYELFGLDINVGGPSTTPPLPPEKTFSWDLMDDLPPADTIIHLAGMAHATGKTRDAEAYFEVNLGLTQRIFDHFLRSDSKTFVFFSSVLAVTDTPGEEPLSEDHPACPQTPYGQSKLAAEKHILGRMTASAHPRPPEAPDGTPAGADLVLRNAKEGKRVFILRPAMIHGPGNKGNLNLLYKVVKKGLPWPLGAFENQRSFLSVNNLVFVLDKLISKPVAPGTYHLADDRPLSVNEVVRLIAESLNRKPRIWTIPPAPMRLLARSGDFLRLPLNSERLKKLTESYVVSNQKAKRALGIAGLPVDAADGIRDTLNAF